MEFRTSILLLFQHKIGFVHVQDMVDVANFECELAQASIHITTRLALDVAHPDFVADDCCSIDHLLVVEILEVLVNGVVPSRKLWGYVVVWSAMNSFIRCAWAMNLLSSCCLSYKTGSMGIGIGDSIQ